MLSSRILARAKEDPYPRAARVWMWTGAVFFSWPILADIARLRGTGELREVGPLSGLFMAIAVVVVIAWKRDEPARSRWLGIAGALGVVAGAVAQVAHMHIAWQGRVLGYAFLLFVAAHFGPKVRGMSDRAPESLAARMKWYGGVLGLEALTITMVASAWSLAMPTGLGGDPAHPPDRGLVILAVWLAAVLVLVLIGWPAAKRLLKGGLSRSLPMGKAGS
jgi:hypothetical protein